jgi:hypothetical protein
MVQAPIEELDAEATLAAVEGWQAEQRDREARQFRAAARFADLHATPDPGPGGPALAGMALAGMERLVRMGGAGTPRAREFAELGAALGRSIYAGQQLIADALDVRHRLPVLWAGVLAGTVPVWLARRVASRTRELSVEQAGLVDRQVATYADGRLSWTRFEHLLEAKVIQADPEAAAAKERLAAEERFAKVGRSTEHGQKTLYVKSTAAAITRIDASIDYLVQALRALGADQGESEDRLRATATLILANPVEALRLLQAYAAHRARRPAQHPTDPPPTDQPAPLDGEPAPVDGEPAPVEDEPAPVEDEPVPVDGVPVPAHGEEPAGRETVEPGVLPAGFTAPFRPAAITPGTNAAGPAGGWWCDPARLLPTVVIYLHLHQDTVDRDLTGVARWEGQGPVTAAYVRDMLGPDCRFVVKPVLDLARQAPVDGYEIPDAMREQVHLRTPAEVFPYSGATGRRVDLDHTIPYQPGGPPGQTSPGNLGPLGRRAHRAKTHGGWQVQQPFPGIYLWRSPTGRHYLVDHTGTRRITAA